MPDQPADPLDYEMTIPPGTHHDRHEESKQDSHERAAQPSKSEADPQPGSGNGAEPDARAGTAKDTSAVRGGDQPQAVRQGS